MSVDFSLLDTIPMGLFVLDSDYHVLFWNTVMEDWTGHPRHTMLGKPIADHYPHLTQAIYTSRLESIFEGGPPTIFSSQLHQYIIPSHLRNGNKRIQHTTVTTVADRHADGPPRYHALFCVQDVTELTSRSREYLVMRNEALTEVQERQQVEDALKASEARYRMLSEMISDYALSFVVLEDGTVRREWSTDALVHVTGYTPEEFDHKGLEGMTHPADLARFTSIWKQAIQKRADMSVQHRLITKRGEVRHIQTYIRPELNPENGHIVRVMAAVQDITAQKLAEERLRESEERFRQIAENVDVVIFVRDVNSGNILYANPAFEQIWQRPRTDFYNDPNCIVHLVHPEDQKTFELVFTKSEGLHTNLELIFRVQDRDGRIRWMQGRNTKILDGDNKPYRCLAVIEDITDRKLAADRELALALEREQVQMMSSFITDSSHEFKTPLSIINSSLYLLRRADEPERVEHHLQMIGQQVSAISTLVDALVMMIGLENSAPERQERIDVNSLLGIVVDQKMTAIEQHDLTLRVEIMTARAEIFYTPDKLSRAIGELIDNAVQYTEPPGQVTVRLKQNAFHAIIEVEDTGIGIPKDQQARIFDRFYRVDKAHSTRGFGLGLAIVRKIIEDAGGSVEVSSTENAGSCFTVRLPLAN